MVVLTFTSTTVSGFLEADFDQLKGLFESGTYSVTTFDTAEFKLNGTAVTATATELNLLDGKTAVIGNVVEDTTPQLGGNLDLNSSDITGSGDINITGTIDASGAITTPDVLTTDVQASGSAGVNIKNSGGTSLISAGGGGGTGISLNGNVQMSANNILTTGSVGDASAADLTKLSEVTATSTELNYVDGVTSNVQTQLNSKSTVSSGASAPATTPGAIGDLYVETTTPALYYADATASSADWNVVGGGGGGGTGVIILRWSISGFLYPGIYTTIPITDDMATLDITELRAGVDGLPVGADVQVDFCLNGTATTDSILTSDVPMNIGTAQTITNGIYMTGCDTAGATVGTPGTTIDGARDTLSADDVIYVVVRQVGSTSTGAGLHGVIEVQ